MANRIIFPPDFVEAFEDKTHMEFDEEAANAILDLLFSTASGRLVACRKLVPLLMEVVETQALRAEEYPEPPVLTPNLHAKQPAAQPGGGNA